MPRPVTPRGGSTWRWRKLRRRVLERDHWRCQLCGRRATHAGHIVPRVLGGLDAEHNLRAECADCNLRAGGTLGRSRQLARRGPIVSSAGRRVWAGAIDLED